MKHKWKWVIGGVVGLVLLLTLRHLFIILLLIGLALLGGWWFFSRLAEAINNDIKKGPPK